MTEKKTFDDERLITLVRQYNSLYDKNDTYYDDVSKREDCWKEIAKAMGHKEETCRKKWKHLREAYRKSIRVRENRESACRPWKFEKQMEFVKCFMGKVKREKEDDDSGAPAESGEDTTVEQESSYILPTISTAVVPHKSSEVELKRPFAELCSSSLTSKDFFDPMTTFFISMAETVKTLPLQLQVKVKKDILEIVSNAELEAACPGKK